MSRPFSPSRLLTASMLFTTLAICRTPQAGSEKPEDKQKWDVNNPPGPRTTVPIDTRTGTWMNLDVSPAGDEIVFELLGDIYSMPIAGGEAKALTSGIAWDMQPRYSQRSPVRGRHDERNRQPPEKTCGILLRITCASVIRRRRQQKTLNRTGRDLNCARLGIDLIVPANSR